MNCIQRHDCTLQAILCDFDGVLCCLDKDCALSLLTDVQHRLRIPPQDILEMYFFSNPYFREIDTGTLAYVEMLDLIRESCWIGTSVSWLKLWERIWDCYTPSLALRAVLEAFVEADYPVVIVTDNHKDFRGWLLSHPTLSPFGQRLICSAESGVCKPEPQFFDLALTMANSRPEYTCFIDDNLRNVNAANALGLVGIHFTDETTTIKELLSIVLSA